MQRFVFLPSHKAILTIFILFIARTTYNIRTLYYVCTYYICLYIYMNSKPIARIIYIYPYYVLYVSMYVCVYKRALFFIKFFFPIWFFYLPIPYYCTTRIIYTGWFPVHVFRMISCQFNS